MPDPEDLADGAKAEAVALFLDRAREADAHFILDGRIGHSHQRLRSGVATWTVGVRLGRLAAVISGLLASAAAATAAFANPIPVGDGGAIPVAPVPGTAVRMISAGGMAGWQITLIALRAALAAAAALLDRKLVSRRSATATTA